MRAILIGVFIFVAASVLVAKTLLLREPKHPAQIAVPTVEVDSAPSALPPSGGVASKLPIELIGTIVRIENSLATIKVSGHERINVEVHSPVEAIATVTRIERERVYFINHASHDEEYVRIRPFDPSRAVSAAAIAAPGDEKEFHVLRANVDQQLANLPQLLMTATATPVVDRSGRVQGFRIDSLDDSSFFKTLGLQAGDVLTEVNGTKLESVEGVMKLFNELRDSSMIQMKVSRQSRDLHLRYLIR